MSDSLDQYAVIGNPIEHSKSPQIHTAFAEQTEQALNYGKILGPIDGFRATAAAFFEQGGKGLNVTVPFKLEAFQFADVLSKRAQQAGAVNTLLVGKDDKVYGDNTDGVGMVRDITRNHGGQILDQRVLVLGAGGAVRGVLGPLLEHNPKLLVIANRTVAKAEELAELFANKKTPIEACGFTDLADESFDLIINGTAASLGGELPPLPAGIVGPDTWCYDMMYSAEATPFNLWAAQQGAVKTLDGLGMLVEQAAESFFMWRQVRPQTGPVMAQLRGG